VAGPRCSTRSPAWLLQNPARPTLDIGQTDIPGRASGVGADEEHVCSGEVARGADRETGFTNPTVRVIHQPRTACAP
jgi:hypothetical protein